MKVHNIGIDSPDFKSALMMLVRSWGGFKLKRLEGQFDAYRHCFNGDVTLEMLKQSKTVKVEDSRKGIRAGEDETPSSLKIRLDDNMRITVPVDGDLRISLSEKSFMLVTKTGVIMGRKAKPKADRYPQIERSERIESYERMKKHDRRRRKETVLLHQRALAAVGISVMSAIPTEDNEGVRCVQLTLSNGHRALMY